MYIPFEQVNPTSRIWIYQSNRAFNPEELSSLENKLQAFTEQWLSHGTPVNASYKVVDNQFIILTLVSEIKHNQKMLT